MGVQHSGERHNAGGTAAPAGTGGELGVFHGNAFAVGWGHEQAAHATGNATAAGNANAADHAGRSPGPHAAAAAAATAADAAADAAPSASARCCTAPPTTV